MTTLEILITIAGALGIRELIPIIITAFSAKNKAESKLAVIDVNQKEDELRDTKLLKAYDHIQHLQQQIDKERDKWIALSEKAGRLMDELNEAATARKAAEYDRCTVPNCPYREPPRTPHTKNQNP